jgi:hypothetical protein
MIQNKEAMGTKFNFNSAICTSRSQSERLLALGLKPETADMSSDGWNDPVVSRGMEWSKEIIESGRLPAWSLHRLLYLLPRCVESYRLAISESHIEYRTSYDDVTIWWRGGGNIYDMIVETIEWLIKEGYFNKEYLEE